MLEMNFGCEAEIFASDLQFKMYDDSTCNRFRGFANMKTEDMMSQLKSRLNKIVENFQRKFSDLHNNIECQQAIAEKNAVDGQEGGVDPDLELHLGLAVYLSTYADIGNQPTRNYMDRLSSEPS